MSITVKGEQGVVEQPKRRRFLDGRCIATVRSWRGQKTAIERFANENRTAFADGYEIVDNGQSAELYAEFQDEQTGSIGGETDGVLKLTWERDRVLFTKPIETHPYWATQESNRATRATGFAAAQAYLVHRDRDQLLEDLGGSGSTPTWIDEYLEDRSLGVEEYYSEYYVLRRRRILSNRSQVKLADGDVFTVTATSPLASEGPGPQRVANTPKFTVPAGLEWLKMPTQVNQLPGGKVEAIEEWYGADEFSDRYYTVLT
jgi:hypothetical protein